MQLHPDVVVGVVQRTGELVAVAALGVPFGERVGRFEEAVGVLRLAFAGGPLRHQGPYYPFEEVVVSPGPVPIPIVLGGNGERALRRAVALGDGWITSATPEFDDARRLRDRLAELSVEAGRSSPLVTAWRIAAARPEIVAAYRAEGFESLVVWADAVWVGPTLDERRAGLARTAAALGLP